MKLCQPGISSSNLYGFKKSLAVIIAHFEPLTVWGLVTSPNPGYRGPPMPGDPSQQGVMVGS
ncbi:hypothetical protein [Pasteuria penetrans]|uniref:hypothetical protein n=1 Tax=Pasteuria penetrans TaxID=86005 RepID=UPI001CAA4219|nr:hypothetical protein [Pasteuria penetrans]